MAVMTIAADGAASAERGWGLRPNGDRSVPEFEQEAEASGLDALPAAAVSLGGALRGDHTLTLAQTGDASVHDVLLHVAYSLAQTTDG